MKAVFIIAGALSVTACASLDLAPYKHADGWRAGEVEIVSTAGSLPTHMRDDCRAKPEVSIDGSALVVQVSYRSNRMVRHRVLPLPEGMTFSTGDPVYVQIKRCTDAVAIREKQPSNTERKGRL